MNWTASDFERLDPKLFRAFLAVMKTQSFTKAGEEAFLTQSAVSQQIAKLEEKIGVGLFVRAGSKNVPTDAAIALEKFINHYQQYTQILLESINSAKESMRGTVTYAMPEGCIHSPHFPMLLDKLKHFPEIRLRIQLKPTDAVYQDILEGDIDFGFVSSRLRHKDVHYANFCYENYVFVAAKEFTQNNFIGIDELLKIPMILYPGMLSYLNYWTNACLNNVPQISQNELNIRGEFNDIRGAIHLVENGFGATVLPYHIVATQIESGQLRCLAGHGSGMQMAQREISIAYLASESRPLRVRRVIGWFLSMHPELHEIAEEFQL